MSELTLNELTLIQNMERIERRMDSLEARWRAFELQDNLSGTTSVMRGTRDERIALLEGLLREVESHLINSPYINAQNVGAKIRKALEVE